MIVKGLGFLLLLSLVLNAYALRNFFLGRNFKKDLLKDVKSTRVARTESFTQILDHFDPSNTASWSQKYLVSEGNGSVAFLLIDGEGPIMGSSFSGYWTILADEVGAWTFELEHRFYGTSQPLQNLSIESLRFLSSDQALADCATFIAAMNEKYNLGSNVTWVAFGGSYAGSLAAWVRYKYPHLVHAAVSSSGPLEALLNFGEYMQVVADDFANSSQSCIDAISSAFTQIQEAVTNGETEKVKQQLLLCEEFTPELANDPRESASFYRSLTDNFAYVAQYNGLLGVSVSDVCQIMTAEELGGEFDRFSYLVQTLLPDLSDDDCVDFRYDSFIEEIKDESLNEETIIGLRQWSYQTCTEFGFYQTTDLTTNIFGDTVILDWFTKMCSEVYGEAFDESLIVRSINNTNILKGSTNLEVTNVVFVHGSHDPWHKLGIVESSERSGPAILIEGTSHCSDMFSPELINNAALQEARENIRKLVLEWLS